MRIGPQALISLNQARYSPGRVTSTASWEVEGIERRRYLDTAISRFSPETLDLMKGLDLSKVKPQQLRNIASQLYFDGQISRGIVSDLYSLGSDEPEDREFDALEKLQLSVERARWAPHDRFYHDSLQAYRESLEAASGLRDIIDYLRSGRALDVTA